MLHEWITTQRRRLTQTSAQSMSVAVRRDWMLEPVFVQAKWREFYAWCRSYVTGDPTRLRAGRRVLFPDECPVCAGSGYVRGKRIDRLLICPRWSAEYRSCIV